MREREHDSAAHGRPLCLVLSKPPTRYEIEARGRKVFALAEALRSVGKGVQALAGNVANMSEAEWAMAAKIANVNRPSLQARIEVVAALRASAKRKVAPNA